MCQELILKYNAIVEELLADYNIKLVMVSIGIPEKGRELASHLGLRNGADYLFVDPDNALYDDLKLNMGIMSMATSYSFLERFTTRGGMDTLFEVLSKWKDAIYVPPKPIAQALNQGGTFVFTGPTTNFVHYDESVGDHANINQVMDIAIREAQKAKTRQEEITNVFQ
mmetsp:Transcript_4996/g.5510  ORF Transcript_4996/g.5510 Transcript_4996/m.5510 type:complete len:168 (+) Transcript_4996:416-919(+)